MYPPPAAEVAEIHADVSFPDSHPRDPSLPYVAMNMVASLDGKASSGGKSGAMGSPLDREAMRTLRSKADAVMTGAGTLRAEKASLTSEGRRIPEPLAIVVSASLDFPIRSLLHAERERTIILTILTSEGWGASGAPVTGEELRTRAEVMGVARDPGREPASIDLLEALRRLKEERGVDRLILEGGPTLNHGFISRGLACEMFLTVSPKILGGFPDESAGAVSGAPLREPGGPEARLISMHTPGDPEAPSEVFLRYRLHTSPYMPPTP